MLEKYYGKPGLGMTYQEKQTHKKKFDSFIKSKLGIVFLLTFFIGLLLVLFSAVVTIWTDPDKSIYLSCFLFGTLVCSVCKLFK